MAVFALIFSSLILDVNAFEEVNLALRKPASQSSTLPGIYDLRAEKAVDGKAHGDFMLAESCSHTTEEATTHWWMVDLQTTYTIKSVRITNHMARDSHKLALFTIEVSTDHPSTLRGFPGKTDSAVCKTVPGPIPNMDDFPLACEQPVTGRYVRIVKPSVANMALVICEFKVYEDDVTVTTSYPHVGQNLALGKPATQVHTSGGNYAWKAVDGNRNTLLSQGSCSATNSGENNWWQVDLLENHLIGSITMVNRLDWASWNLSNFWVEISEDDPRSLTGFPGRTNASICMYLNGKVPIAGPFNFKCRQPLFGRYVRLVRPVFGMNIFICEFEVFAHESTTASPTIPAPHGINGHLAFRYVISKGPPQTTDSETANRYVITCGKRYLFNMVSVLETPYMLVDTTSGTCHFLRNAAEGQDSLSDNWVIYKAPNL